MTTIATYLVKHDRQITVSQDSKGEYYISDWKAIDNTTTHTWYGKDEAGAHADAKARADYLIKK